MASVTLRQIFPRMTSGPTSRGRKSLLIAREPTIARSTRKAPHAPQSRIQDIHAYIIHSILSPRAEFAFQIFLKSGVNHLFPRKFAVHTASGQ